MTNWNTFKVHTGDSSNYHHLSSSFDRWAFRTTLWYDPVNENGERKSIPFILFLFTLAREKIAFDGEYNAGHVVGLDS